MVYSVLDFPTRIHRPRLCSVGCRRGEIFDLSLALSLYLFLLYKPQPRLPCSTPALRFVVQLMQKFLSSNSPQPLNLRSKLKPQPEPARTARTLKGAAARLKLNWLS